MITWYDITIGKFNLIKDLDLTDIEGQIRMIEVITGEDLDNLPLTQLRGLTEQISFLSESIPETLVKSHYDLNDHAYDCRTNIAEMSVSQYMDFTNLSKENDLIKILGVFLIPEGKSYGEYDIEQVYKDIECMSIVDAYAVFNFFKVQFVACYKTMEDFLDTQMKKGKMSKEFRRTVLDIMDSYCTLDQ